MPPPIRYPEKMFVRLPKGTRKRVLGHQLPDEPLTDTQRRVILAGLGVLDEEMHRSLSQNPNRAVDPESEE